MAGAQLVWFDPGASTGMAVISIRASWLAGRGDPGYIALGRNIAMRWVAQVGREAKVWDARAARSRRPSGHVVDGAALISQRRARAGTDELTTKQANLLDLTNECESLLILWPDAAWGYEDFSLRPTIGSVTEDTLSATCIYAALTYAELTYGEKARVPFTQSASFAKTTVDDAKLRAACCYYPGMKHANDAMRHVLLFAREARSKADIRVAAWPKLFRDDGSLRP
jgi:hypothetical protein